jgi:hypothetical protein
VESEVSGAAQGADYRNPTETLPDPPPEACHSVPRDNCQECASITSWWSNFRATVNDLLLKSNVHKCSTNWNKDGSQNKARPYKGCLDNIWGKCKAHFPRSTFKQTEIDTETGCINMKKSESWLNSIMYVVTYLFRCNTDITSLRSGTGIKGVLLYVSNYVTKPALKTHVIFETVRSMFQKHSEMIGGSEPRNDKARKLMTKIVNSLSAKMEMGNPMVCMYLLGNPDHYTNYLFIPFYWQSYVREASRVWAREASNSDHVGTDLETIPDLNADPPEKVTIFKCNGRVIGLSPVQDYVFCPASLHSVCLYDWIATYKREKIAPRKLKKKDPVDIETHEQDSSSIDSHSDAGAPPHVSDEMSKSKLLPFLADHPLAETHGVRRFKKIHIPNFIGNTLPRCDQGDREYYCSTMLTLFKPWRNGLDLKSKAESWDDAFLSHRFSPCQVDLMKDMNIRYECLDARDDFHAQM